MSSKILVDTLNELLGEVSERLKESEALVTTHEQAVERARENLQRATDKEAFAKNEDESVKAKLSELNAYCNKLVEKPQVILDKIHGLNRDQGKTIDKYREAHGIVDLRKRELREAETHLRMAQEKYAACQKEWSDLSEQIQRVVHPGQALS